MTHPTVTQADRELAADLMAALFTGAPDLEGDLGWAGVVRKGEDDEYPIVLAFARHRTATEASTAARIAALEAENGKLREALEPSGDTKAAYMGELSFNLHRIDEFGDEYPEKVYVPWTTIKEIMAAIATRAALTATEGEGA